MNKKQKSETIAPNERMLWADIIRIIAIYLVIHLHTVSLPFDKISVPLFVMLSGALLLGKQESYLSFINKRVLKVFIPWVIWTVIYMFFSLYLAQNKQEYISQFFPNGLQFTTLSQWVTYSIRMFFSALWFLPLIFSLYLLTPILRKVVKDITKFEVFYIITIWFLYFSLMPFLFSTPFFPRYEPNLFYTAFQFVGYFILGFVLIKDKPNKNKIIAAGILLVVSVFFVRNANWVFVEPPTVIASISAFYLLYGVSKAINPFVAAQFKKFITLISGACFGIYVVHGIILGIWGNIFKEVFSNTSSMFLYPLLIFVLSALIILVLQRIPLIKHIVP